MVLCLLAAILAWSPSLLLAGPPSSWLDYPGLRSARVLVSTTADGGWRDGLGFVLCKLGCRRYDGSDPLAHHARAAIYDHVEEVPGTYLSAISTETGIALPTVRYHLKVLEREDLVTRRKLRGRRRYFLAGLDPSPLAAALADDGARAVLEALADHGPASVSALAETLDRDPSTVSYHLQQLAGDDLVDREREGPAVVNRLPPSVEAVVHGDE